LQRLVNFQTFDLALLHWGTAILVHKLVTSEFEKIFEV